MLFSPFSVKSLTLKNRVVMPPMCMYSAKEDGKVTDWHRTHYATRAIGQTGLIIVEATGVTPGGRISAKDLGLWDDSQVPGMKSVIDLVHRYGGKIAVQLNHAGRKSLVENSDPVAPSPLPFDEKSRLPKTLTPAAISQITAAFADAAQRAVDAGFDAIELHGAHGYLLNQFLSPLTNQRNDEYGGSAANRARLLIEATSAVRRRMPADMPLFLRVSAFEYEPDGNKPEDVAAMINLVRDNGPDVIHVSSGAVTPTAPRAYPGYQIGYARVIKDLTGLPVIGGGLISEPSQAEQVVKSGVDLVFLGRQLLREPYWPLRAAHVLGENTDWPEPYQRGQY